MKPANIQDSTDHDPGYSIVGNKWFFSFQISWILWIYNRNIQTTRRYFYILYNANVILYKLLYGEGLFDVRKHLISGFYFTGL